MYSFGEEAPSLKAEMNGLDMSSHPSCGLFESILASERVVKRACALHVVDPFRGPVVGMGRPEGANVMRLTVIIPNYDLNEARAKRENLTPSMIPEQVRRKDPVLAV